MRIPGTRAALGAAAAIAVLGAAAPAGAQTLRGTVVHHNRHGHSFSVALKNGSLRSVHARRLPKIGRVVAVNARALSNGTFAAHGVRAHGRRGHARLHGTVTFADRRHHRFTVSSGGVSLLVRAASVQMPATGEVVDVEAHFAPSGTPVAQSVTPAGTDFTIRLEGTVAAVDTTARTITVSADDDEQSGAQLTISVPDPAIDLTAITPGQEVELLVALHSDGTFSLLGIAGDDNARNADDHGDQQGQPCGEDNGDRGEQGDQEDRQDAQQNDANEHESGDDSSGSSDGSGGGD